MTSRRYKWQTRWAFDPATRLAAHQDGLIVSLATGRPIAQNGPEYMAAMAPKHGGHNTPRMLERLLWEARELYTDAPR